MIVFVNFRGQMPSMAYTMFQRHLPGGAREEAFAVHCIH